MTGAEERKRRPYNKPNAQGKRQTQGDQAFANSPVVKAFEKYSAELDAKHDKYERIVKLSRDVTISSKRIIYSIHGLMRSSNYNQDVDKIKESFKAIDDTLLKSIAMELENEEQYKFLRAYFWGLQEYIEALTFFHYVISGNLFDFEDLKNKLIYQVKDEPTVLDSNSGGIPTEGNSSCNNAEGDATESGTTAEGDTPQGVVRTLSLGPEVPDYVLGIQDLTGELMRYCINSFSANRLNSGYTACDFVKRLYSGMVLLSNVPSKEFFKKMTVARQSLEKMEMACYTTRVRGSEALAFQSDQAQDNTFESYSYYD